jgi:hypothetical protein
MAEQLAQAPSTDTTDFSSLRKGVRERSADEAILRQNLVGTEAELKKAELGIEAEYAKNKASKQKDIRTGFETELANLEKQMFPAPERKMTQEDATTYAQLASMVGTLGIMLGGGAKGSARVALGAMNGMMKGWQAGRKDLWDRESKTFEAELKKIKFQNDDVNRRIERAMKLMPLKREEAMAELDAAKYLSTQGIFPKYKDAMDAKGMLEVRQASNKLLTQIDQLQLKEKELERRHRESMQNRMQAAREKMQQAGVRRDEKAMQAIGPALRNIAENYPDGTANSLLGASPEDKKRIQGSYRALEESESVADFVASNPGAVGAMAVIRNFIKMDAIKSIGKDTSEEQAAQIKSAAVDAAIDRAQQQGKISSDDAQQAKVLQKKLFGLALADVQGSGQRGSVYLDRQFQNLYDQASRQDTLLKIIRERAEENNRNLSIYKMNVERHSSPGNFPLVSTKNDEQLKSYIDQRKPKSTIPSEVESKLNGKPDGTGYQDPATNKIYRIYGGVVRQTER